MKKITAGDSNSHTAELSAETIAALQALIPEAFADGKVNLDTLRQLLGELVEGEEKFGLNWHGKRQARQLALTPSTGTLRPAPADSAEWNTTQNLMIEGDNLEVLKLLQKSYAGKVKLIYIDPPYNTGSDFVYPDSFQDSVNNYLGVTGQIEGGKKASSNTESGGRYHTDWLNMIYPRLRAARSLLSDVGVLLVSIDDTELHHLRAVLDSIFGAENYVGSFVWEGGRKNDSRLISVGHDYVVVYAREQARLRELDIRWRERKDGLDPIYDEVKRLRKVYGSDFERMHAELLRWFRELPDGHPSKEHDHFNYVDARGVFFPDNLRSPNPRPNLVFEWKGYKPHPNGWAYSREKMAELDAADRLVYPAKTDQRLKVKSYLHEHESWSPGSVFYKDRRAATKELASLLEPGVFDYPKDIMVMRRFVTTICGPKDIILDFFAGSGTTGHAVMQQNAEDGGKRRYVLVQLPEPLDPEDKDQRVAADFCDKLGKPRNIAEITKERLRRAAKKIKEEHPDYAGDLGFRVFKLDSTNIRAWDPDRENIEQTLLESVEHIKGDRSDDDVLYEILLKLGLDLATPIETKKIAGHSVQSIGVGTLLVCLSKTVAATDVEPLALGIAAWHAEQNPAGESTVVFRDSAFADDVAKTNLTAILEQHGLTNVRSL